eukprot:gnl/Hemi2/725_TR265_c0_g9_i1.p2 gnl/Hemi2/725_TR265_c0_g9~~gnl/Hemi2/725_TR265_c0_g9_i1.p2  ORF type:complete len:132 (+),score=34.13 gnl/Hemi2/725_TR265_c0_g9_i1:315-710(+)
MTPCPIDYVIGRLPQEVSPTNRTFVLAREANYHPDGGQVVCPQTPGTPYVALLASHRVGDNIKLEDFVAFYCDGSFGIHIHPGTWHMPFYPCVDKTAFRNKQGRVHACIGVDTVTEFNRFLKVPLTPPTAA